MFARLGKETENIINHVLELVYFMRGGIGYEEMMSRTPGERHLIEAYINRRLEAEKNKPNPTY